MLTSTRCGVNHSNTDQGTSCITEPTFGRYNGVEWDVYDIAQEELCLSFMFWLEIVEALSLCRKSDV